MNSRFYVFKWFTFCMMYAGYTVIVLCRKSFSFALPAIVKDLAIPKDHLGLISSSFNLAYTMSKFMGGLLSDRISSKLLFAVGIFASGVITLAFTVANSAIFFSGLLFFMGICQGGAWPACAKILRQWFAASAFATWYGILNTAMNVACSVGPVLTAYILATMTWTDCLLYYGLATLGVGLLSLVFLVSSPNDVGLEKMVDLNKKEKGKGRGRGRGTWKDMLRSPFMWLLCISYMVVFMTRTAALDWAQLYLIEERGQSQYVGSAFVSSLETGGIIGSITAGYFADKLITLSPREDTRGTPRMTVALIYIVIYIAAIHALVFLLSSDSTLTVTMIVAALMGFGIYGPVSLYGVMAIEAAPTHLSGTSHAMVAMSANVGAVMSGLPLSFVAKFFDWRGAFILLELLSITIVGVKIAFRNLEYKMVTIKKKMQ